MITCQRTDSGNPGFQKLVKELDAYLAIINGTENSFFAQFNTIESIQHVVVAYEQDLPIGCGAIKEYAEDVMEVKRMFVLPERRGQGIAARVLNELENWAKELQYQRCVLETGDALKDAIRLYEKAGYITIPNYGQYENVKTSVCFEKVLG